MLPPVLLNHPPPCFFIAAFNVSVPEPQRTPSGSAAVKHITLFLVTLSVCVCVRAYVCAGVSMWLVGGVFIRLYTWKLSCCADP